MALVHNYSKTQKGPCAIWAKLGIPAANARLAQTGGVPDVGSNPDRLLLGLTEKGATVNIKMTTEEEYFDEFYQPLGTDVTQREFTVTAELSEIYNIDVLETISKGMGTKITGAGYEGINIGAAALAYTSIAVISPLRADPTKFSIIHIYQAFAQIDMSIVHSKAERAKIPVTFVGYGIPSRAASDTHGSFWWQI